jgi:Tfp pilus assembly ATPase PilU
MNSNTPSNFGRRFGEIDDLPEELKTQLQAIKVGDLEQVIIDMLRDDFDGMATLDEILVGLYRRKKEVFKRQAISNRLYRMNKAGLVISVPQKKGVYRSAD